MGVERDFEGEFDVGSRDVDDVFDDFVVVMVDRGGETRRVDVDAGVGRGADIRDQQEGLPRQGP